MDNSAPRNQKSTDFYTPPSGKKWHRLSNVKITDLICNVAQKICFLQRRTLLSSALKVIGNLMNVLHCPQNEVKQFWDIVQLPVHLILQTLGESSVPKAVLKSGGEYDSI
jgi:hypothetical protein